MASVPQNVTRIMLGTTLAPPAREGRHNHPVRVELREFDTVRPLIVMAKSGQRFANWRDCCRLWIGATEEPFRLFLNWLYREREDGRYLVRSDDVRPSMRRLGVSRRDLSSSSTARH